MAKVTSETTGRIITATGATSVALVANTASANSFAPTTVKTSTRDQYIPQTTSTTNIRVQNPNSTVEVGEQFLVNRQDIANVYNGSSIDPLYIYPVRTGQKLYISLQERVSATIESDTSAASVALPFTASIALNIPDACLNASGKAEVVTETIRRLISYLYPKGLDNDEALIELISGKLF